MVAFPGCKINLGLHILSRRPDGYHELNTGFYPVPWSDLLEFVPSKEFSLTVTGLDIPGLQDDNLVTKAYRLLKRDVDLPPIQGHLHKLVPMGAGLGGGSADAAHALRLLDNLFELNLAPPALSAYAQQLGSDCSFFLTDTPAIGRGRGDLLEPLELRLKGHYLVIFAPEIHIATADAYAGVTPQMPKEKLHVTLKRPVTEWREWLVNDFEPSVFSRFPVLAALKESCYAKGALYASLSGSGSSVFGLFDREVPRTALFPGIAGWSGWL